MDQQTREAVRRLSNNSDFQRWLDYIRRRRTETVELTMVENDPPCLYRYQGTFSALDSMVKDVEKAHDVPPIQRTRPIV